VPQFYLRYFATPETRDSKTPQAWIFSKDASDSDYAPTSVRNVCGKRYLYAPKDHKGNRNWDVDDQMGDLETVLGQIWPELATGYVNLDDVSIRKAVSLFISVMHFRHVDNLREVEKLHAQLVALYEAGPLKNDGTPAVDSFEVDGRLINWIQMTGIRTRMQTRMIIIASLSRSFDQKLAVWPSTCWKNGGPLSLARLIHL
jgi:hypothetical protein